jgi:catechol 2,3-dioxygenase-like lactoylglutathione lyase family enzyme
MNLNQVTLPALDVAVSVEFYCRMGFQQIVDAPHYARFRCPEGDASFSVHLVSPPLPPSAVVVYFETPRLDETVEALRQRGFTFSQEPRDEPWLWREARLLDPSGNVLCLYWAGASRLDPPWRVHRSD